jgi:hypothetical protein
MTFPAFPTPSVAPTDARQIIVGSRVIAAGSEVYVLNHEISSFGAFAIQPDGENPSRLTIDGTVFASQSYETFGAGSLREGRTLMGVHGAYSWLENRLDISQQGRLIVHSAVEDGWAEGVYAVMGGLIIESRGLIQVGSDLSDAVGVAGGPGIVPTQFINAASGRVLVSAGGTATGVWEAALDNAGLIDVQGNLTDEGWAPVGVYEPMALRNTGVIRVTSADPEAVPVGVTLIGPLLGGAPLMNAGLIEAAGMSIHQLPNGDHWERFDIINSGTLIGDVVMGGAANVRNSGWIEGAVVFGDANSAYDGDDVFSLLGGECLIDGQGGFNVLDLDRAASAVEVSLAAGSFTLSDDLIRFSRIQAVVGSGFADRLTGDAQDNGFQGGAGDDAIDGGGSWNLAAFSGARQDYTVTVAADGSVTVVDNRAGSPDGTDGLTHVQTLRFDDLDLVLGPTTAADAIDLAFAGVLREAAPAAANLAFHAALEAQAAAGGLSPEAAAAAVVDRAANTTSVATLAYQFFTGQAPSEAGMDYLVSPTGPNANNLNSAYYQWFNLENRYINFAVNLGKVGEGAAAFTADYGALSLFEATRKAYAEIFGASPSDTKVSALLAGGRGDYFAYYGRDGAAGIGTKAAMVGWLLAEAVKANDGVYALANEAFLTDVALHDAPFAVDVVGHYAQPSFVYDPG